MNEEGVCMAKKFFLLQQLGSDGFAPAPKREFNSATAAATAALTAQPSEQ